MPRHVERLARASEGRTTSDLLAAVGALQVSDVDGAVRVVVARTAARAARDPADRRRFERCGGAGYLVGRTSLGVAPGVVSSDPQRAVAAERARSLLRAVRSYDLAELAGALGPGAREVLDGFVATEARSPAGQPPSAPADLRKAALVGLGVAVAEAESAGGGATT